MGRADCVVVTRASLLARTQTEWVVERLRAAHPGLSVAVETLTTRGDRASGSVPELGDKGLWTVELEQALLDGSADIAVHSLKDLPTELPEGLTLGAVPPRAESRDALVLPATADAGAEPPDDVLRLLPPGARVGTSSLRRQACLRHGRPDLVLAPLRGNVDTRLRKLDEGQHDAAVLAAAGLQRIGRDSRISALLPIDLCTPAPGQGALGIEMRAGDERVGRLLAAIHDADAADCVVAERAVLAALGGGCQVPCGASARVAGEGLVLLATVAAPDGTALVQRTAVGPRGEAVTLGRRLAEALLAAGAERLLTEPTPDAESAVGDG